MSRYFIEVSYKGTNYSGFQIQKNANSIQAELQKALKIYYKEEITLTGSSRTDTGVHALQNYFHFDTEIEVKDASYNLNSILPDDIVVKKIFQVSKELHCRFDAILREYSYYIYIHKDPFLADRAFYYPYSLDMELLQHAAQVLLLHNDFATFSKRNTQVKTTFCNLFKCEWIQEKNTLIFKVSGNRFLRGMVRGMVGTMLRVGSKKITLSKFIDIVNSSDCTKADFSVPPQGLFLTKVKFPFN